MMEISLNYMQKNPNINTASLRSAINSSLRGEKPKLHTTTLRQDIAVSQS